MERRLHANKTVIKLRPDDSTEQPAAPILSVKATKLLAYTPDISRAIAGLILASNDSHFREECFSLLNLETQNGRMEEERLEVCIGEKIASVIKMNDGNPQQPGLLFKDHTQDKELQEEDDDDRDEEDDPYSSSI